MSFKLKAVLLNLILFTITPAFAQSASDTMHPERGWFFFETKKEPEKEPEKEPDFKLPPPKQEKKESKEDKCKKKETWTADCGFIDPGEDFEFQSKQRDALMERMAISKNNPKAVEDFQYYMRWVLERASEVTNLWWYNMVQNPELDPTVANPVSAFGIRLMSEVQKGKESEIFKLIKEENGGFVYFSRHDCVFCHKMEPILKKLSKDTGLPVRNAALDDKCMEGFEEGCLKSPATLDAARALQVATVPALFLHVSPNTWLRISTGVTDLESLKNRTIQFFLAYRAALLGNIDNSVNGRPSVSFSGDPLAEGNSKGISPSTDKEIKPPDQKFILDLINKK